MKHKLLSMSFLTICFIFLPFSSVGAQGSIELPEIKGSYFQVYQDLRIEITAIKRMDEYQAYWNNSERARGRKLVAEPGFEIALVRIIIESKASANLRKSSMSNCESKLRAYPII